MICLLVSFWIIITYSHTISMPTYAQQGAHELFAVESLAFLCWDLYSSYVCTLFKSYKRINTSRPDGLSVIFIGWTMNFGWEGYDGYDIGCQLYCMFGKQNRSTRKLLLLLPPPPPLPLLLLLQRRLLVSRWSRVNIMYVLYDTQLYTSPVLANLRPVVMRKAIAKDCAPSWITCHLPLTRLQPRFCHPRPPPSLSLSFFCILCVLSVFAFFLK